MENVRFYTDEESLARVGGRAAISRMANQVTELRARPEHLSYDFSRIKVGDQFYANGQCRFKFELNRKGDGFLRIFTPDGCFIALAAVQGRKIEQDLIFYYYLNENDHRVCSVRQMVKGKLQGLMLDLDQDEDNRLICMSIFDRKGFSIVPMVYFDPDGSMEAVSVSCNYDHALKHVLKPEFVQRFVKKSPDNEQLKIFLQHLVHEHGGSELNYLTVDNELKPEWRADFCNSIVTFLNKYSREIHPELEAPFLEFCAGEKERRAQGIVTTFDMVLAAIPQLKSLNS